MNLSDSEILELSELCNALVDGRIDDAQKARLSNLLEGSEEARRVYVRLMGLSASLYSYASELQVEAPDAPPSSARVIRLAAWSFGSLAAAASIILALWLSHRPQPAAVSVETRPEEYIARLTGSKDCRWTQTALPSGASLSKGQRLEIASGYAEITFDSGAQVVIEGPASLELNSAWQATLNKGTAKASVPPEAIGFELSSAAVNITDLGTEFTMIADGGGSADVLVLKGEVEASPSHAEDERKIVLRQNQSRHFASSGVSRVSDSEQKFARFSQPVTLDHFSPATEYVHWSFDDREGELLKADGFGRALNGFEARLILGSAAAETEVRGEGRRGSCLRFNGSFFTRAALPRMSGDSPHTVGFWVKVAEDAQLSSAYAMVAWSARSKKLGSHPVHVGWNRNPAEGSVGVLRTDYGGGYALGATPLRDGRWHYVAVVFVPGDEAEPLPEVKQYVDGRLEGEGKASPPGTEVSTRANPDNAERTSDTVWFGCRLGSNGPRKERFRGDLDELWIADRALGPREIVSLMRDNQPPANELVLQR